MARFSGAQSCLIGFLDELLSLTDPSRISGKNMLRSAQDVETLRVLYQRKQIALQLHKLKQREYIALKKRGGELVAHLTRKGLVEALKLKICKTERPLPFGEKCVVVFDIPEALRHVRTLIRRLLREIDFEKFQKSVWIGDRDIIELFSALVQQMKAEDYIQVFRARLA